MSDLNLVELADQLTIEDLAELFARMMCLDTQVVARQIIDTTDDVEVIENYTQMLENSEAMISNAQDIAYECHFHHYDFSNAVDEALERVAEEYIR